LLQGKLSSLTGQVLQECKTKINSLYKCTLDAKLLRVKMATLTYELGERLGDRHLVATMVGKVMNKEFSKSEVTKLLAVGKLLQRKPALPQSLSVSTLYQLAQLDDHDIDTVVEEQKFHDIPLSELNADQVVAIRKSEKARYLKQASEVVADIGLPVSKTPEDTKEKLNEIAGELESEASNLGGRDATLRRSIIRLVAKIRGHFK